jgi:hypothetical protein
MVKMLQQMKRATLSYPTKPTKQDPQRCKEGGNPDPDAFNMAVFAWKEDYKTMKSRMDKYKDNESNAWANIYNLCLLEFRNKLRSTEGYNGANSANDVASC